MSAIHFFITPNSLTASTTEIFGPINTNEFSTTTKFSAGTSNALAYAVCKGHILITPQTGSGGNLVNVILKPSEPFLQGLPIKYIVYRGLQTRSFFNNATPPQVLSAGSSLINKVRTEFADLYGNMATPPIFFASQIGYFESTSVDWADSKKLSSAFFKISDNNSPTSQAFELPLVQAGESIGTFANNSATACGIDVVLDYGDYELPSSELAFNFNLGYARKSNNSIDVSTITNTFAKKVTREQIYQFVDIAALYGAALQQGKDVSYTDTSGNKQTLTGDSIYTQLISKFTTKNNWYIYINSDRGRSYNFYSNYQIGTTTNSLKIGTSQSNLAVIPYSTNNWPLLIINSSQNHNLNFNSIYINLVTDNNPNTSLYCESGLIQDSSNNFQPIDKLIYPIEVEEFLLGFTKPIILSNNSTGNSGSKLPIANLTQLIYKGKIYSFISGQEYNLQNQLVDVFSEPDFTDDIFNIINASNVQLNNSPNMFGVISSTRIRLINFYDGNSFKGITASQSLIINDSIETDSNTMPNLNRVTYLAEANHVFNNPVSLTNVITSNTQTSLPKAISVEESNTFKLPSPYYYSRTNFNDGGITITGITLNCDDNRIPNQVILGITMTENDVIKSIITTNNLTNAQLFLINLFGKSEILTSLEGVNFLKYKLGVVGEIADGSLKLFMPSTDIIVYSIDNKYHHSKGYSDFKVEKSNQFSSTIDRNL